jgi:hypothetical protein
VRCARRRLGVSGLGEPLAQNGALRVTVSDAIGKACVVPGDRIGRQLAERRPVPLHGDLSPGRRAVVPAAVARKPALASVVILTQVVQETRRLAEVARAERLGELASAQADGAEVIP